MGSNITRETHTHGLAVAFARACGWIRLGIPQDYSPVIPTIVVGHNSDSSRRK
jgi:hypothetical protein